MARDTLTTWELQSLRKLEITWRRNINCKTIESKVQFPTWNVEIFADFKGEVDSLLGNVSVHYNEAAVSYFVCVLLHLHKKKLNGITTVKNCHSRISRLNLLGQDESTHGFPYLLRPDNSLQICPGFQCSRRFVLFLLF